MARSRAPIPMGHDVDRSDSHLEIVGRVVKSLTDAGFEPILVGGMALVILGSQRVTRDFDFVIALPRARASKPSSMSCTNTGSSWSPASMRSEK